MTKSVQIALFAVLVGHPVFSQTDSAHTAADTTIGIHPTIAGFKGKEAARVERMPRGEWYPVIPGRFEGTGTSGTQTLGYTFATSKQQLTITAQYQYGRFDHTSATTTGQLDQNDRSLGITIREQWDISKKFAMDLALV